MVEKIKKTEEEWKPKKIGDMLGRFTVVAQNGEMTRAAVSEALKEAGLTIATKDIKVYKEMVRVKISPAQRSELFLKQERIIEALRRNPLTAKITKVC